MITVQYEIKFEGTVPRDKVHLLDEVVDYWVNNIPDEDILLRSNIEIKRDNTNKKWNY